MELKMRKGLKKTVLTKKQERVLARWNIERARYGHFCEVPEHFTNFVHDVELVKKGYSTSASFSKKLVKMMKSLPFIY